jgi:hypothetical protein
MTQLSFPEPHARRTDPYTSDKALKAIAKDTTLMASIWEAMRYARSLNAYANDTYITERIEQQTNTRQQRSVVARSRGLLEQAGMIRRVGVMEWRGREFMHFEIDPNNPKENPNG